MTMTEQSTYTFLLVARTQCSLKEWKNKVHVLLLLGKAGKDLCTVRLALTEGSHGHRWLAQKEYRNINS